MNFSTGGLLIGVSPKCLLIRGDHLFLNYIFFWQWRLINQEGLINPDLTLLGITIPTHELIFFRGVGIPPTRIDLDEFDQDQEPRFPSNDGNWIRGIIPKWLITAPKIPKIPGSSNS